MAAPPPILITSMDHFSSSSIQGFAAIVSFRPGEESGFFVLKRQLRTRSLVPRDDTSKRRTLDWMESRKFERGRLRESPTDVEGLYRLTRRPFHQVVERGHDDHAVGVRIALEADVTP